MRTMPLVALLAGAILIAASCSGDFSGTFADQAGVTTYEFRADGRVDISVLGTTVAAEFKLDDDRILVTSPQGTVVLTRNDDRLYGPMGLELVRQRE